MGKNSRRNIVLFIEILVVFLASIGILEREAVLIMTGLLIFYFIFSAIEDSLILFIISIPLFVALPITDSFETMANWRILLAILFLGVLFKRGLSIKILKEKFKHRPMEYLVVIFLIIACFSLFVALYPVIGIKKILFLINIFLLYVIVRNALQWAQDKKLFIKIVKTGAVASVISLIIGYSQLISIFFVSLYNFWQWWARNVVSVFYGFDLSKLLAISNTWFSYYENSPPTLRMFSVFPDSHSFALFTIIGLVFFSYLLLHKIYKKNLEKWGLWLAIILSFLALIFSGSRGVWVSAVIPFLGIIFLFIRKVNKPIVSKFIVFLIIFALAFPISSLIISASYKDGADGTLAFKRAKSITDLEELSVKNRMGIWKSSFDSILKRPILGVGIGNYPIILGQDISTAKKGASAHNLYLDIASEMGLLGLVVLLLIFWQILKKSWKTDLIFVFFFVWILIYSLFDVVLLNDKVLLLFMIFLGMLYSKEKYVRFNSITSSARAGLPRAKKI